MTDPAPEPQPTPPTPGEPTPTEPAPPEPTEPEGIDYGGSQADINAAKEQAHQQDAERLAVEHGIE